MPVKTCVEPLPVGRYGGFTPAQLARVRGAWAVICAQYPPGSELRLVALDAAVEYIMGRLDPAEAGRLLAAARRRADHAMVVARQVALLAIADGAEEKATAEQIGVDRMAVRRWQGKR